MRYLRNSNVFSPFAICCIYGSCMGRIMSVLRDMLVARGSVVGDVFRLVVFVMFILLSILGRGFDSTRRTASAYSSASRRNH